MATAAASSFRDIFFQRLSIDREGLLLLDYDGTLAPFQQKRNTAFPYAGVRARLHGIMRSTTEVVIVSGRQCSEVATLLGVVPQPEIWGCHGAERLDRNGNLSRMPVPAEAVDSLRLAASWLELEGVSECLEIKYGALCVHWRGRSPAETRELRAVAARVFDGSRRGEMAVLEFDGGLELRYQGARKSSAVRNLAARKSDRCIAYCGDDFTDEDAFAELNGRGLTVLVRPEFRPTKAMLWLTPPEELEDFLDEWLVCCGGVQ